MCLTRYIFIVSILFFSCAKDQDVPINIKLTDAPGDFVEVNVEIKEVQVKMKGGSWRSLITHQGVYNLLDFATGNDTLIAYGSIPAGTLQMIRLELGDNNSVVLEDSSKYMLIVPSGSERIKVNTPITVEEALDLLIDFDAKLSIKRSKDGNYMLHPVVLLK